MKPLEIVYFICAILGGLGSLIGGLSNLAFGYQRLKTGEGMGGNDAKKVVQP